MKRKVAGVLAAAMAAGMLAGCGSSAKPADTTAAKAEDTKAAEGSTEALKRKARKRDNEKPHSPHRATIMAMILPGSGQIYNRQWWKLPILYGGIGATVYGLSWNMKYYKKYRTAFVDYTAYLNALEADPETPYPANSSWDKLMLPGKTAEKFQPEM